MNAYDETFLNDAQYFLGELFETGVYVLDLDLEDIWMRFLFSNYSLNLGAGDPFVIFGKSGSEAIFEISGKRKELPLWGKIICFFLSGLAIVMAVYLCGGEWPSVNGYNVPQLEWLSFLIAGVVFAGVYCAGYLVCRKGDVKQLWAMLLVMVVIFTVSLLPAGFVIKLIIHRPRYRYLVRTGVLPFYNWWENCANYKDYIGGHIDGFPITKEDFKSFPSGHSGTGMIMAMFLSYAPIFFKKLKGKETIMFYIGVLWGLTMMFSRMLVGAHYLTDTCMGSLIVMVVFYIANEFAYKKGFFETKEEEVEPVAE